MKKKIIILVSILCLLCTGCSSTSVNAETKISAFYYKILLDVLGDCDVTLNNAYVISYEGYNEDNVIIPEGVYYYYDCKLVYPGEASAYCQYLINSNSDICAYTDSREQRNSGYSFAGSVNNYNMSLRNLKCLLIEDAYKKYKDNDSFIKTTIGDNAEKGYGIINCDISFVKTKYDSITAEDINNILNN